MNSAKTDPIALLRQNYIFRTLSNTELSRIWKMGTVVKIESNSICQSDDRRFGYINLILEGQLQIERKLSNNDTRTDQSVAGQTFGEIETLLGSTRFIECKALTTSAIFVLPRTTASNILNSFPTVADQITHMKSAVALAQAENYQKQLQPSVRVAPRVSTTNRNLRIKLENGIIRPVDNVSISGLGINGEAPGQIGQSINFEISGSPIPGIIKIDGKITRIFDDSFGVELLNLTPELRQVWEEVIVDAISAHILPTSIPELLDLDKPLKVDFILGSKYCSGTISQLCATHATLNTQEDFGDNDVKLSLTLPFKLPSNLSFHAHCQTRFSGSILIEFVDITAPQQALILKFISSVATSFPINPGISAGEMPAEIVHSREATVRNLAELNDIVYSNANERVFVLRDENQLARGNKVRLRLKVPMIGEEEARFSTYELEGVVLRMVDLGAILDVSSSNRRYIESLKQHASILMRERIKRQIAAEPKTITIPRPVRIGFVIFSALFVVVGAWLTLSHEEPAKEAEIHQEESGARIIYAYDLMLQQHKKLVLVKRYEQTEKKFTVDQIHLIHFLPTTTEVTLFLKDGDRIILDRDLLKQLPPEMIAALQRLHPAAAM